MEFEETMTTKAQVAAFILLLTQRCSGWGLRYISTGTELDWWNWGAKDDYVGTRSQNHPVI